MLTIFAAILASSTLAVTIPQRIHHHLSSPSDVAQREYSLLIEGGGNTHQATRGAAEAAVAEVIGGAQIGTGSTNAKARKASRAAALGVHAAGGSKQSVIMAAALAAGAVEMSKNRPEASAAEAAVSAARAAGATFRETLQAVATLVKIEVTNRGGTKKRATQAAFLALIAAGMANVVVSYMLTYNVSKVLQKRLHYK